MSKTVPPPKGMKRITFNLSEDEHQILDRQCQNQNRTKTEILRELIRGLEKKEMKRKQCI